MQLYWGFIICRWQGYGEKGVKCTICCKKIAGGYRKARSLGTEMGLDIFS